jgi:peptidoglycan/LPS O-acetylase OafA/YrhL
MAATSEPNKIFYLESLRGIAALSVAIYHFNTGSMLNNAFTRNAWLMVDFFFVLSGFVISLNYQDRIKNFADLYNFQTRRFLRLYPLHLLTLLIFLGLEITKYLAQTKLNLTANFPAFSLNNAYSFSTNLLLIQSFVNERLTWNYPSWSISAEFYTYALFGLITLLFAKQKILFVGISVIISLSAFYFLITNGMNPAQSGVLRCLYSFFLGVLCFNIHKHLLVRLNNFYSYFLLVICIFSVIYAQGEQAFSSILIPVLFMLFILCLVTSTDQNKLKYFLRHKILIYIGTISFGIYMLHAAVWWIATQLLRFAFKAPTFVDHEGVVKVAFNNPITSNLILIAGLLLVIFLAHLSYKFIEMPINELRHKLSKPTS